MNQFDCTPDIAHEKQMTQVVRYVVKNNDNDCEIMESFLKCIRVYTKTEEALKEEI